MRSSTASFFLSFIYDAGNFLVVEDEQVGKEEKEKEIQQAERNAKNAWFHAPQEQMMLFITSDNRLPDNH